MQQFIPKNSHYLEKESNYFSEFVGQFIALARAEQAEAGTAVLPIDVAINEN